jgi:SAM-dependent methyltransferase
MAANPYQSKFYPETNFGGFTDVDGTILFYSRVNALLKPEFRVVDFGCGRGAHGEDDIPFRRTLRTLRGKVARVIGIDVDPAGTENTSLDEFHLLRQDGTWPLDSESVDLIVCDNVMEHLPDPELFFSEASRVLRREGYVLIRTPNRLGYVGVISSLVPNRMHAKLVSNVQDQRKAQDVFPTLYRCNTVFALRRALRKHGFQCTVYGFEAEPSYLKFSKLAYGLGVIHQKLAPKFMRLAIFAFGQKQ